MNDNIDTDQILPKQFLKLIDKKGFCLKYLMYAWRYSDHLYILKIQILSSIKRSTVRPQS